MHADEIDEVAFRQLFRLLHNAALLDRWQILQRNLQHLKFLFICNLWLHLISSVIERSQNG